MSRATRTCYENFVYTCRVDAVLEKLHYFDLDFGIFANSGKFGGIIAKIPLNNPVSYNLYATRVPFARQRIEPTLPLFWPRNWVCRRKSFPLLEGFNSSLVSQVASLQHRWLVVVLILSSLATLFGGWVFLHMWHNLAEIHFLVFLWYHSFSWKSY